MAFNAHLNLAYARGRDLDYMNIHHRQTDVNSPSNSTGSKIAYLFILMLSKALSIHTSASQIVLHRQNKQYTRMQNTL